MNQRDAFGRPMSVGVRALPYDIRCAAPRCQQVVAQRIEGGIRAVTHTCMVSTSGLLLVDCPACRNVTAINPAGAAPGQAEAWQVVDTSGATRTDDPAVVRKISEA